MLVITRGYFDFALRHVRLRWVWRLFWLLRPGLAGPKSSHVFSAAKAMPVSDPVIVPHNRTRWLRYRTVPPTYKLVYNPH